MKSLLSIFFLTISINLKAQDTIGFYDFYINPNTERNIKLQHNGFSLTDIFEEMLISKYPFNAYKGKASINYEGFLPKYRSKTPSHVYENINSLKRIFPERTEAFFINRFIPNNGNYYLVSSHFFGYGVNGNKELLITYDTLGHNIDHLESCVTFSSIYLKQWKLTSDMQVIVCHLDLQPIDFIEEPPCTRSRYGQRIDTYYQIDSTGKFRKIKEIRYKPRVYTADYLNDKTVNIWEGQEEKMPFVQ